MQTTIKQVGPRTRIVKIQHGSDLPFCDEYALQYVKETVAGERVWVDGIRKKCHVKPIESGDGLITLFLDVARTLFDTPTTESQPAD